MDNFHLQGFGPVGSPDGSIEVSPLTILIGENGCGKSYSAMAFHSIFSSDAGERVHESSYELQDSLSDSIIEVLENVSQNIYDGEKAEIESKYFNNILKKYYKSVFAESIEERLRETFSTDLSDLITVGRDKIAIQYDTDYGPLKLGYYEGWGELRVEKYPEFSKPVELEPVNVDEADDFEAIVESENKIKLKIIQNYLSARRPVGRKGDDLDMDIRSLLLSLFVTTEFIHLNEPYDESFYLPAPRAGFLESHEILTAGAIDKVSKAGIERQELPAFSGSVSDYLTQVGSISQSDEMTELADIAQKFEQEVMGGKVKVKASENEPQPDITFSQYGEEFPFYLTSTGMSEMAPLTLFTKYKLSAGSVIIIEEPEAHLHPENQRKIAQFIVRLVNNGVRVILTTHSDFFIEQLNNLVRLSGVSENKRKEADLGDLPVLSPDDISINMFESEGNIEYIPKPLEINEFEGIPMDEFEKVGDQLYGQAHKVTQLLNEEHI